MKFSAEQIRFMFGVIGNVTAILNGIAPVPTFWRIWKKRATESFSVLPYMVALGCNAIWVLYGLPCVSGGSNILVLTISVIIVAMESVFVGIYIAFAPRKLKMRTILQVVSIMVMLGVEALVILVAFPHGKIRKLIAGVLAAGSSCAAWGSPLSIVGLVIKTKSVEYMPFLLSFSIALNTLVWTIYGIIGRDVFVMIADGVGFLFGVLQLLVYVIYYKESKRRDQEKLAAKYISNDAEKNEKHNGQVVSTNAFEDTKGSNGHFVAIEVFSTTMKGQHPIPHNSCYHHEEEREKAEHL